MSLLAFQVAELFALLLVEETVGVFVEQRFALLEEVAIETESYGMSLGAVDLLQGGDADVRGHNVH